ncbi:MAG: helix-turn-helix domain-containing protein [Bifidobacteriaceae bacterium]|nr:helix-turn-helix domain-containing protein [Bifidobacteriaceae bacterium]
MDIAARIKSGRIMSSLSIARLAEMAGVSARTVSRVENRESDPTAQLAGRILGALGLELGVERTENPSAIAAARKIANPDFDGRIDGAAEALVKAWRGWELAEMLRFVGRTNRPSDRAGARTVTCSGSWLEIATRLGDIDWILTGGAAANELIPVGGDTSPVFYVPNPDVAARALTVDPHGRTVTLLPFNGISEVGRRVLAETWNAFDVPMADEVQLVIDCNGVPNRGQEQGEALLGLWV